MKLWREKKTGRTVLREDHKVMLSAFWEVVDEDANSPVEPLNDVLSASEASVVSLPEEVAEGTLEGVSEPSEPSEVVEEVSEENIFETYSEICQKANKDKSAFMNGREYKYDGSRWRKV